MDNVKTVLKPAFYRKKHCGSKENTLYLVLGV